MPPPRSHSLEQHNYADHKKQPTTATGKDTKDIRLVDMLLPNLRFCGSVEGPG